MTASPDRTEPTGRPSTPPATSARPSEPRPLGERRRRGFGRFGMDGERRSRTRRLGMAALALLVPLMGCGGGGGGGGGGAGEPRGPSTPATPGVWMSRTAGDPELYFVRDARGTATHLLGTRDHAGRALIEQAVVESADGDELHVEFDASGLPTQFRLPDGSSVRFDVRTAGDVRLRVVDPDGTLVADETLGSAALPATFRARPLRADDAPRGAVVIAGDFVTVRIRLLGCDGRPSTSLAARASLAGVYVEDRGGLFRKPLFAHPGDGELRVEVPRQWSTGELTLSECEQFAASLEGANEACESVGTLLELAQRLPKVSPHYIAIMATVQLLFGLYCDSVTFAAGQCLATERPDPSGVPIISDTVEAVVHVATCAGTLRLTSARRSVTSASEIVLGVDACEAAVEGSVAAYAGLVGSIVHGGEGTYEILEIRDGGTFTEERVARTVSYAVSPSIVDECEVYSSTDFSVLGIVQTLVQGTLHLRADLDGGELRSHVELERRTESIRAPTPAEAASYQEDLASCHEEASEEGAALVVFGQAEVHPLQRVRLEVSVSGEGQAEVWFGLDGDANEIVVAAGSTRTVEVSYDEIVRTYLDLFGDDFPFDADVSPACVPLVYFISSSPPKTPGWDGTVVHDRQVTYRITWVDE